MSLVTRWSGEERPYTGIELRPHFLLSQFELKGSAIVAFAGPCKVETEHLVDWEDRMACDRIEAARMVHFIGEFFGMSLREGVLFQRLAMSVMRDVLNERLGASDQPITREGDDLWWNGASPRRKISVSIVTASPVSVLLHAGINFDPEGAPVAAIGLKDLGWGGEAGAARFAEQVLSRLESEWSDLEWACVKVRPVM